MSVQPIHPVTNGQFRPLSLRRGTVTALRAFPEPSRRGPRADVEPAPWLVQFLNWQRAQGISQGTYRRRRNIVEAFAEARPGFLTLTDAQVEHWLESLGLAQSARSTYRSHLRALFEWAQLAGHNPVATLPRRGGPGTAATPSPFGTGHTLLEVSHHWREPLHAWVSWLHAAARADGTILLREFQVRHLGAEYPEKRPFELTTDDLAGWLAARPQWSAEYKRSHVAALRSFYGWALATGRTDRDPSAALAKVRQPHRVSKPAPEDVISAALSTADPRLRLMILLAARLGLRRAEIAQLHTDDVREGLDGLYLRILGKGDKERVLPVVDELAELLPNVQVGWVFPGDDEGHLSPRYVGKLLSRALGSNWTAHTLRHRFATVAYSAERDVFAVQQLLGHSSPDTTRRYVQLPPASLWAAVRSASR